MSFIENEGVQLQWDFKNTRPKEFPNTIFTIIYVFVERVLE